jgi:Ca2+-binding EF-hand superfamily protein
MTPTVRYSLFLGAALAVCTGVAIAQMGDSPAPPAKGKSSFTAPSYSGRGRLSERFLGEFDMNKDNKVTHDEFNRTLAHEFSVATKGGPAMSLEQYASTHLKDLRDQANEQFHRIDWNGDGKLSQDEYMAGARDQFEQMDRDGTGVISCSSSRGSRQPGNAGAKSRGSGSSGGGRGAGARGRTSLCFGDDLNRDGKVTRAEFDKATQQAFTGFAKGGALNPEQFYQLEAAQSRAISTRVFQRLDRDRDGKLTLSEFASSQERLFTRLDKNNDGVIAQDELTSSRRGRVASRN